MAAFLSSGQGKGDPNGAANPRDRRRRAAQANQRSRRTHAFTAAGLRQEARERPATVEDAGGSVVDRFFAWLGLFLLALPLYIVVATVRNMLEYALDVVFLPLMIAALCLMLFSSASFLVCVARFTLIKLVGWRGFPAHEFDLRMRPRRNGAYVRGDGSRQRLPEETNGFVRWLCTPSHTDVIFPLLWTLMIAPVIIADIPR
ncbi:hypothetical protein GCM10009682_37860 [Luedemannella flava]|uniref:Uncharacterized protein n=1 Tax=Luedemannella flava TaxID=349316 RepID=A0ABP4YDZ4_9ACTN